MTRVATPASRRPRLWACVQQSPNIDSACRQPSGAVRHAPPSAAKAKRGDGSCHKTCVQPWRAYATPELDHILEDCAGTRIWGCWAWTVVRDYGGARRTPNGSRLGQAPRVPRYRNIYGIEYVSACTYRRAARGCTLERANVGSSSITSLRARRVSDPAHREGSASSARAAEFCESTGVGRGPHGQARQADSSLRRGFTGLK
mmetsp:Transcript_38447/g.90334  ORF Transcript_38447/g.90334 Transcript_38447/m.90334 type:complete len:202 (+) Transcript_38447:91-696(+)